MADRETSLLKAVGNAPMLFKNEVANYLEVITVQSNLFESQLEFVAVEKASKMASEELYQALGEGCR